MKMFKNSKIATAFILFAVVLVSYGCSKKTPPPAPETKPIATQPTEPATPKKEEPVTPKTVLTEAQFRTVYFDFDKFNLRSDAKAALDANYELLKNFPDVIVKIEGHCDERGTVEYNLSLGEKRARSTMDYLAQLGVGTGRMSIISFGKERPADGGHNEGAWQKNRRCEFRIISQ
jgi:peptidoglycan-associated lipoprotein